MKRIFDIVSALVLIVITFPLMIIVAIWIKFESQGPVIFIQRRVGKKGKEFNMYKFRSMIPNAEQLGPHYTHPGDIRLTKSGKVIRRISLDELPQLFNVIRGEMSLVGPRPNVMSQREEYNHYEWKQRNSVRPGITGLAQATLRSAATQKQRLKLDLAYTENISIAEDIRIIILTIKQLLTKGSH